MRRAPVAVSAALAAIGAAFTAGCSHDWDSLDPRLGAAAGGATASAGGAGPATSAGGGPSSGGGSSSSAGAAGGSGGAGGAGGRGCAPPGATGYSAEVLADCPVSYWRLGGRARGDGVADELDAVSGDYEDAPVLGVEGALAGDVDAAVLLDGDNDGLVFGDVYDLLGDVSFTIELWAKPSMYGTEFPRTLSKESNQPLRNGYTMFLREPEVDDPNQTRHGFECWLEGEVTIRVLPDVAPALDVWTHVVARMDGAAKQLRVFHDGVIIGAQDGSDCGMIDNVGVLRLGGDGSGGGRYAGALDEVAIYDHALSDARILAHWQVGSGN